MSFSTIVLPSRPVKCRIDVTLTLLSPGALHSQKDLSSVLPDDATSVLPDRRNHPVRPITVDSQKSFCQFFGTDPVKCFAGIATFHVSPWTHLSTLKQTLKV